MSRKDKQFINMGCSITNGSFLVLQQQDKVIVKKSNEDEVLIFFFLNLLMELQNRGTAPAMDILQYAKALESI
jgi:hypothetical protein